MSRTIAEAKDRIKSLQRNRPIIYWSWFKQLAEYTNKIDFPCDFNEEGICISYRRDNYNIGCCCGGCALSFGYFNILPKNKTITKRLLRLFDTKHGFWRKGKGCILPRKLRSPTCLGHVCSDIEVILEKTDKGKQDLKFLSFTKTALYPRAGHKFKSWLKKNGLKFSIEVVDKYLIEEDVLDY